MKVFTYLLVVLVLLCSGCSATALDKTYGNFKEFGGTDGEDYYGRHREVSIFNLEGSICGVTVIGEAEGLYPDVTSGGEIVYRRGSGLFTQRGSAFHIGNGLFVTAYHVINPVEVEVQISSNITYIVPVDRIVKIVILIGNGELGKVGGVVVWTDPARDLALIQVPKTWGPLTDMGYELIFTKRFISLGFLGGVVVEELNPGTVVATIVRKRVNPDSGDFNFSSQYEVRYGRVITPCPSLPDGVPNEFLSWFQMSDVTTDLLIYPGDSGSPVFAFINGRPVLVGVVRAIARGIKWNEEFGYMWCFRSYFARIDMIAIKAKEK